MTIWERIKQLPQEHQEALAALLALWAEKYVVAAEQEIKNNGL